LENWTDLFGFVPRPQLVDLLPKIDDRKFASVVQFFLNKCGEITFGKLEIKERYDNGNSTAYMEKDYGYGQVVPLADAPIPENVKTFKAIHLRFFRTIIFQSTSRD
jgi:hypothetical protein